MKFKLTTITGLLVSYLMAPGLSSCVYDNYDDAQESKDRYSVRGEVPVVMININSLTQANANENVVSERISYLRIIMLDGNQIEFNKFISSFGTDENGGPSGGTEVNGFEYNLIYPTMPGEKSFFVIGNEQTVKEVKFEWPDDFTPPAAASKWVTLSDVLDYYASDGEGNYPDAEGEFATVMNSLYFEPEIAYSPIGTDASPSLVHLPYTAYYPGLTISDVISENKHNADNNIPYDMYLVPAATKVYVEFINQRKNFVQVNSIKIGGIASAEFLNAQLDESELYKGEDSDVWWIDWLGRTADGSQLYPGAEENNEFNILNGWIDKYRIPKSSYPSEEQPSDPSDPDEPGEVTIKGWVTMLTSTAENNFVVPAYSAENGTGNKKAGPFYLTESDFRVTEYVFDKDSNIIPQEVQAYYLTLDIEKDIETSKKPVFENVRIGNLKSLFRNTSIRIVIEMRDWDDNGAFAEINPWNVTQMNGFIVEEDYQP